MIRAEINKNIPDELKEKLFEEMVSIINSILSEAKNPELTTEFIIESLPDIGRRLRFNCNEEGLLKPYKPK